MSRAAFASAPALSAPIVPEPLVETGADAAPGQSEADRREHARHNLDEMPFTCKARLKFGPAVTLIDISNGGAQIQTTNYRIQPGSAVVLELTGEQGDLSIPATVLRCQLASLLPEPIYRGALVFRRDFDVRSLGAVPEKPEPVVELNAMAELENLRQAVGRLALGGDGSSPTPEPVLATLHAALATAHATLETPAGRRAGAELGRELAALYRAVATALQRTPTPAALQASIEEHLHHVVPALAIGVGDVNGGAQNAGSEAILFTIPSLSPESPRARLTVAFPDAAEPQELHLQILKASVHLLALARELARLNGVDRPLVVRGPEPLADGWSGVVVCYANGQTRDGFTTDFTPTSQQLELWSEPASSSKAVTVPFAEVRTIRFVKDAARAGDVAPAVPKGRKLRVTFKDGQQLEGTTESYRRSAPGFFVYPLDPQSDDQRIFVVGSSHVQVVFG